MATYSRKLGQSQCRFPPFYGVDAITQPNKPTQGFLLWDEQYLYIGARVYDPQMKRVQITQTNPDSAVWLDDTLEILVDPNPKTPTYHHLVINPIGTVFDQHIKADYPLDHLTLELLIKK